MQVLAQRVEQGRARIELQRMLGSVDAQHEVEGSWRGTSCLSSRFRREPRHELPSYNSSASDCSDLQQLSSGHIRAGHRHASLTLAAELGGRADRNPFGDSTQLLALSAFTWSRSTSGMRTNLRARIGPDYPLASAWIYERTP